jgi:DNA-binding MarR family transcriptional regulator
VSAEPRDSTSPDTSTLPGSRRIGHLLCETSARVTLWADPLLADLQLSLASIGALERIAAFPGITASELARQAFKTQQAVSQVTGRLERLGYVERRLGPGRGVGLYVTSQGEAALADGTAREAEVDSQLQLMLGAEDAEQLRALLKRLRSGLIDATE